MKMLLLAALTLATVAPADAGLRVVDGDTIRVGREFIRIIGLDAPETDRARCGSERAAGLRAKARLAELLAAACGPLREAAPTCLDIARLPRRDRYGRSLALVWAGGRNVADVLISEGLARPYDCPGGRCQRRAGWCEGE